MDSGEVHVEILNDETLVMVDDGPEEGMHLIHRGGEYYELELVPGQNPVAVDELPRNVDDIYSDELIMKDGGPAAQLVFNVGNCVDMSRVCREVPTCPPDRDGGFVVYVLSTEHIKHVLDLTNDGLSPWNSLNPTGGRIKSSSRTVGVTFKEDGTLDLKDLTNFKRAAFTYDCFMRCYYARNPNEPNLVKRIYYAMDKREDKIPRKGTFAVISYQFSGPVQLFPRVHRNVRHHRQVFKRVRPSVANVIRQKLRSMPPQQAREATAKELQIPVEEIDMKAVHNLAKQVKDRVRAFPQGRRPYKDDPHQQHTKRRHPAHLDECFYEEYQEEMEQMQTDQKPVHLACASHPHHEEVIDDVDATSVECARVFDNIVVSEEVTFSLRLPAFLTKGIEGSDWDEMEKAANIMRVEMPKLNEHDGTWYTIVTDIYNKKCYYVDVESEPAVCQCDYRSRGLYVCEHILAVLCSRTDGEIVLHRMANYEQAQEAKVHDPHSS
ncbi:hypothetical protein AAVH_02664 [Aphelenchoides avenae]|nr:hypothetical protein AAVH_02664 [Aphelenchus avenae]